MTKKQSDREWLAWELNWLQKFGYKIDSAALAAYGQTPVEYITQVAEFKNRFFLVNQNVLIPRQETEVLIDLIEENLPATKEPLRIVEIGTGSGAISITLALDLLVQSRPVQIVASDISATALKVAAYNAHEYQIGEEQLELRTSDLWDNFAPLEKFDLVVANLPYIPESRRVSLESSVIDYEPETALFGGEDGLVLIKKMLTKAPLYLAQQAEIWLEVDETHQPSQLGGLEEIYEVGVYEDQWQKPRFWRLKLRTSSTSDFRC